MEPQNRRPKPTDPEGGTSRPELRTEELPCRAVRKTSTSLAFRLGGPAVSRRQRLRCGRPARGWRGSMELDVVEMLELHPLLQRNLWAMKVDAMSCLALAVASFVAIATAGRSTSRRKHKEVFLGEKSKFKFGGWDTRFLSSLPERACSSQRFHVSRNV